MLFYLIDVFFQKFSVGYLSGVENFLDESRQKAGREKKFIKIVKILNFWSFYHINFTNFYTILQIGSNKCLTKSRETIIIKVTKRDGGTKLEKII